MRTCLSIPMRLKQATTNKLNQSDFLIGGFYLRCTASLSERIPQANAESCIDKVKRAVDQKMDLPRPRIPNYDQIPRQNSWSFDGVRINITNFEKLGHRFSYKELLLLFGPDGLKRYMDQFHRHFKLGFIVLDINYAHKKYPIGRGTIENFQEIDVTSIS